MNTTQVQDLIFTQSVPERIHGTQPLVVPVCGWVSGPMEDVGRIDAHIDGIRCTRLSLDEVLPKRLWNTNVSTPPTGKMRSFAGKLELSAAPAGSHHTVKFTVVFRDDKPDLEYESRVDRVALEAPKISPHTKAPRIAICLAVYNPDERPFLRQIQSIKDQTLSDWICIVSDDNSHRQYRDTIETIIGGDERFYYFQNEKNLGFYGNFEAALSRVPKEVPYIALADQDDYWYPNKLERLLGSLDGGALLSYSDMRIVSEDGAVLANSYWNYRKNSYENLQLMLVANTVTGAACMMRQELLGNLVPFPPRVGDAFHDHWIACAALASGQIAYIDEPLYDYYQYGNSIVGHCGFDNADSKQNRSKPSIFRYFNPVNLRSLLGRFVGAGQAVYWHECRRIESICENLLCRGIVEQDKRGFLLTYGNGLHSMWSLVKLSLSTRGSARLTNNAEWRLAHGYLVHSVLKVLHRSP